MSATLIDAQGVARRFGDRTILPALDLRIARGDRVGLLGDNGTGKSTLLRILAGRDRPDDGVVQRHGTLAYLPQLARGSDDRRSVRELARDALGVGAATRALEAAEAALAAEPSDRTIAAHAAALDDWLAVGADSADADLDRAAGIVGLRAGALDRARSTLSSGQGARAGLLAIAARPVDTLLLDEPTNHLDADGRALLDELLDAHHGALVVASHDRELLGRYADRVLELGPRGDAPTLYGGGFEAFERERATAERHASEAYDTAVAERAALREAEREMRRRASVSRSHADRAARDPDKHGKEWVRMRADGAMRRARKVGEGAERIELPAKPWTLPPLALTLTPGEQHAPFVVALEGATLQRGGWSIGPLDLAVAAGERLLLRGPNGSGKSTLLRALAGSLPLAGGARLDRAGAVVSVLGEVETALRGDQPAAGVVQTLTGLEAAAARTRLAAVGITAEAASRAASTLSPGERTRAELAVIAARRTTCLLLDEPSNHLDLRSVQALEAALDGWPGAVVLATHDERLAQRLGATREFTLPTAHDMPDASS